MLDVHVELIAADEASHQAIEGMRQSVLQYIKNKDKSTSCHMSYHVQDCSWPVHGHRLLMCRTTDAPLPFWLSSNVYLVCCFLCLGTIYRILFAMSTKSVVYHIRKEVSVLESA